MNLRIKEWSEWWFRMGILHGIVENGRNGKNYATIVILLFYANTRRHLNRGLGEEQKNTLMTV